MAKIIWHARRDYDYKWMLVNPVLKENEIGVTLDTKVIKIGDGRSRWNELRPVTIDQFVDVLVAGVLLQM